MTSFRAGYAAGGLKPAALYWWARPDAFTLLFMLPLFIICASLSDDVFLTWKQAYNFTTGGAFYVGLIGLLGFVLGAKWASLGGARRAALYGVEADRLVAKAQYRAILYVILGVTLVAYCLLLPGELAGADMAREERGRIAGVRSLVNLGPLYVALLFLQFRITGAPISGFDRAAFMAFVAMTMARVFVSGERLALIEVLIPIALIHFARKGHYRAFMTIAPYAAVIVLVIFFGVTEYFRSWPAYSKTGIPLTDFMLTRLLGYYATAINNGAIIFVAFDPGYVPFFTADWLVKIPGLSALNADWTIDFADRVDMVFSNYASPEFSNTSGLYAPINDFGAVGGIAVWVLLGAVTGRLFRGFLTGRLASLLLFPTWMTGVYEILRIFYWGEARYFPVLVTTPFVALLLGLSSIRYPVYAPWSSGRPARVGR